MFGAPSDSVKGFATQLGDKLPPPNVVAVPGPPRPCIKLASQANSKTWLVHNSRLNCLVNLSPNLKIFPRQQASKSTCFSPTKSPFWLGLLVVFPGAAAKASPQKHAARLETHSWNSQPCLARYHSRAFLLDPKSKSNTSTGCRSRVLATRDSDQNM